MSKTRKQSTSAAGGRRSRRWLNIGPGIVIALAASAWIGSQWIQKEMAAKRQSDAPPIVERQVIYSSHEEKSGPVPEVKFVIARADKLGLNDEQRTRLRGLQAEWEKLYGPKIAEANKAAAATGDRLADAKGNPRTPVAQIQDAAAPVIALSGEISAARRRFWDRAVKTLDAEQRAALQKEREADWAAKKAAMGGKR